MELITNLLLFMYYWLEAIVLFFVPASWRSKDVKDEKVLVTGAGSGIGRLMSYDFARRGAELILWDINESAVQETAAECVKLGAKAHAYKVDLSKREQTYSVADKVKLEVGDVDILINNAGIVTGKKLMESPDHLIEATMNVNTNAHFWTIKSFLQSMMDRNHGHIVTIASMAGIAGNNGLCDYCASKFAAVGLDEALKSELYALGKDGVHTTVVCPAYIDTGMFHGAHIKWEWMAPMIKPEYAASRIMDGILTNQKTLMMTRSMYTVYISKAILPVKCWLLLGKMSGILTSMDEWTGRQKKD